MGTRGRSEPTRPLCPPPGVDVAARGALAARLGASAAFAVERLGEDAGDRRLADAAGTGEQERVMDPPALQRIGQRPHDMLLADQFGEAPGAPFAGEDEVGHGGSTRRDVPAPLCPAPASRASASGRACDAGAAPVEFPARFRRLSLRRDVRAVEGARLESVYTAKPRIEGSNPSLSAIFVGPGR